MICRYDELRKKEVINILDGAKYGNVGDIEFDTETAEVLSLVVYGKGIFFGLFGREDDIVIKWEDIEVIGEDTILIKVEYVRRKGKKTGQIPRLKDINKNKE